MDKKISNEKNLNQIIFEIEKPNPVIDKDTNEIIPGIIKKGFILSAPYRVGEVVVLARYGFGPRDFWFHVDELTKVTVESLTKSYFKWHKIEGEVSISSTTIALYKEHQPALNNGAPLNAFEAKGIICQLSKE